MVSQSGMVYHTAISTLPNLQSLATHNDFSQPLSAASVRYVHRFLEVQSQLRKNIADLNSGNFKGDKKLFQFQTVSNSMPSVSMGKQ
jgi:hypothetical protein